MLPGDGLIDQRHTGGPSAPEQDGGNGDALGILPGLVPRGTVGQRAGEPGVGVGGGRGGGGSPRLPPPVDAVLGLVAHALPPHAAVRGQRHVAGGGGGNGYVIEAWTWSVCLQSFFFWVVQASRLSNYPTTHL